MGEAGDIPKQIGKVERQQQLTPSQLAMKFFMTASESYPASVSAQGAQIAKLCKSTELHPKALRDHLLNDEKNMDKLTTIANTVHKKKGTSLEPISLALMERIIVYDFSLAERLLFLNMNELEYILGLYPFFYVGKTDLKKSEQSYRAQVEDIIKDNEAYNRLLAEAEAENES